MPNLKNQYDYDKNNLGTLGNTKLVDFAKEFAVVYDN